MRVDADRSRNGRFVFTGSQQFGMIRNLGDSLAGRIALLDLLPFAVEEMRQAAAVTEEARTVCHSVPDRLLPAVGDDAGYRPAALVFIVRPDLSGTGHPVSLYDMGGLREFHRFMQLLAVRSSQMLNMSALATDLGVSVTTIKRWLSVLEAGRIIYILPPHFNNLGKRITKMPKIYFLDTGLACHLVGIRDREQLLEGPMAGALFENYCLQETVKIFANLGEQPRLSYVRTNNRVRG